MLRESPDNISTKIMIANKPLVINESIDRIGSNSLNYY